jgi:alkanesulfonate monooxygenase SsuD/methylene tetrahydromethanopterin reductase-like flavin-dependent oxidoreductase (luciferase family)
MHFGIFQSAQWPMGSNQREQLLNAAEQSVLAEALGFQSVFMTEHHFSRHGIVSDNLAMLAYIAAKTSRIRLGTAVSVLPLHNPMRLAESVALVDLLSNGRVDFGIGRGYQWGEFHGFDVELGDRAAMFEEAIHVIVRAWCDDLPFSHSGRYWKYHNATPQPRPLQRPHPPIWMATTSNDGFQTCVENDWGIMLPQAVSLATIKKWLGSYKNACDRAAKPFEATKIILARGLYTATTHDEAWATAGDPYRQFLQLAQEVARAPSGKAAGLSFDNDNIAEATLIGSAERCADQLDEIRNIGIENVIFFCNMGGLRDREVVASMQLFAQDVMPKFSDAKPSASDPIA